MSTFTMLVQAVQAVPLKHNTDDFVALSAFYNQALYGPNKVQRPPKFDVSGTDKWEAWTALGNMSKDEAEAKYVQLAQIVLAKEEDDLAVESALADNQASVIRAA